LEPEDIRALRGDRSRAVFAQLVGVTPLTVYRWELPAGAEQARRPRGKVAARLAELALAGGDGGPAASDAGETTTVSATASRSDEDAELLEVLPLLERLASGDLHRVEGELLALMASGRLRSRAARVVTAQAFARTVLLSRADTSAAFATLAPLLLEFPHLSGFVELQLHVTTALVFGWPDGRFFDVGKVNAHLARAEKLLPQYGTPETRLLCGLVRLILAAVLGQTDELARVMAAVTDLGQALSSPVLSTLLRELAGFADAFVGRHEAAERAFREVADRGAIPASRARAFAQLALVATRDARPPDEVLALIARGREIGREARLPPGLHSMMLDNLEGNALNRLARFGDAARVLGASMDCADELRWTPIVTALYLAGAQAATGDTPALRAVGERLLGYSSEMALQVTRGLGSALVACAAMLEAPAGAIGPTGELERLLDELEREAGWPDVRGDLLLLAAQVLACAGTPELAQRALRRADRHFQQFPSTWAAALLRRTRGVVLARQGRLHEARQLVEAALGTLTLAGDVGNAAYARYLLAEIDRALDRPGAAERVAAHRAELTGLGYLPSAFLHLDAGTAAEPPPVATADEATCRVECDVAQLLVPLQRLAVRGMSPALIKRELVAVVAEYFAGAAVQLDEVDSTGHSSPLLRVGPEEVAAVESVDLADGTGRRLRLGAGGTGIGAGVRPLLTALAGIAELALEVAALRNLGGHLGSAGDVAAGEVPEIPGFVSVSESMRRLKLDLARLSRSRSTVIIGGESGSGKEVVARAIHDLSIRASRPFIAFNCAAVPRELFEGQLFGYRKGSFTGATSDQPGVLRAADGGTVLLDEIGELPLDVQPKLLRFLENGEVLPLGERRPLRLDVRVIAASYRDLEELVRDGRFREDLYYRLQVVPLYVPPLRERPDDIVALARHFITTLTPAGQEPALLAPDAIAALNSHRWPGNVRELRNVIERSLAFEPLPPVLGADQLRFGPVRH